MPEVNVVLGTAVSIREAGLDERWLQDQIAANPSCLGLGELDLVAKERRQASGARLDMLLKDPEDDAMYEVEVMLGETDETHIVRTIEYWDVERRRWPTRQHFAVLVAESITRRFFNVIQIVGNSLPIIAIQVNLIDAAGSKVLHFTKVLDTYTEPEDSDAAQPATVNEDFWIQKAAWTVDAAKVLLQAVTAQFPDAKLRWVQSYIRIDVEGHSYFWFNRRGEDRSKLTFWVSPDLKGDVEKLLVASGTDFDWRKQDLRMKVTPGLLREKADLFHQIIQLVHKSWCE
ncbi:MAG: hypothetical protein HY905_13235 [Deltaproteobacteria bacterium]|nr:hypothetical protein [Deltaproteobacteria bacterium]